MVYICNIIQDVFQETFIHISILRRSIRFPHVFFQKRYDIKLCIFFSFKTSKLGSWVIGKTRSLRSRRQNVQWYTFSKRRAIFLTFLEKKSFIYIFSSTSTKQVQVLSPPPTLDSPLHPCRNYAPVAAMPTD